MCVCGCVCAVCACVHVCYLEAHDEDTEAVQDGQTHLRGDVGLQQRLARHVSLRVAVGCRETHTDTHRIATETPDNTVCTNIHRAKRRGELVLKEWR